MLRSSNPAISCTPLALVLVTWLRRTSEKSIKMMLQHWTGPHLHVACWATEGCWLLEQNASIYTLWVMPCSAMQCHAEERHGKMKSLFACQERLRNTVKVCGKCGKACAGLGYHNPQSDCGLYHKHVKQERFLTFQTFLNGSFC